MIYENVKLGADPELFLMDETGKFISSVGLIGGTKEKPLPIDNLGNCLQEDNVSVEFNIQPAASKAAFVGSINKVLDHLEEKIKGKNLLLSYVPAAEFGWDQLQTEQAQTFGCEPDFSAWTGEKNPAPHCKNLQLRSCGGHIHVGYDKPNQTNKMNLIRAMDVFLGVPSSKIDTDKLRRQLYGKPGAFRPKEYGAEYRTLSNFWILSTELQEWAYDQTMKAISFLNAGGHIPFSDQLFINQAIMDDHAASYIYLQEKYHF